MEIGLVSLIVLAVLGIIDSGYLTYKHFNKKKKLVCPIGEDCSKVIESKWGSIFGVKNEVLGLGFYLLVSIVGIILLFENIEIVKIGLVGLSGGSVLFSGFLVYVQVHFLKNYCFYCLVSAFLTVLIFVNSLLII